MKILMVSIFSNHFFNWTEQLKDSGHEIYWFDVFDSKTSVEKIDFVKQLTSWRYKVDYPGRYYFKKNLPILHKALNVFNERKLVNVFEKKMAEVQPDVVHSFAMHLSCFPIYNTMKKYPNVKWVYSSWGSDLFFYKDNEMEAKKIKDVLSRVDYIFTDCYRDQKIAKSFDFNGEFLGVFPGGGGIDFEKSDALKRPIELRKTILIKGYEGKHGRCISVLKALTPLSKELKNYNMVVFGAAKEVNEFVLKSSLADWKNLTIYGKLPHNEVLRLMGESLIYVGNSRSDGMPNTLLEAVVMGAFSIQSNPGGATEEIIKHGKNGFLIHNPEDEFAISELIKDALSNIDLIKRAVKFNTENIKPHLERDLIKKKVLKAYSIIENNLSND